MLDERHLLVELRRPQTRHGLRVPVANDRALDLRRRRRLLLLLLPGDRRPELANALAHRAPKLRQALRPEDHQGDDEDDDQLEWSNVWHRDAWYSGRGLGIKLTASLAAV